MFSSIRLSRVAGLVATAAVTTSSSANAEILSVAVDPREPTTEDIVHVTISGQFFDGCWEVEDSSCSGFSGHSADAEIHAVDHGGPGVPCPAVIVPYEFVCTYGPLEAGSYSVNVTEHHVSERDPEPDSAVVEFEVIEAVSTPESHHLIAGSVRNLPNPFGASTTIAFEAVHGGIVHLHVFDAGGRLVHELPAPRLVSGGSYRVVWDGRDVSGRPVNDGVYFYRIRLGGEALSGRMVVER